MKKPEMNVKLSRRIFNLCVICLIFGGVLFAWQTIGKLQSNDGEKMPKLNRETTVKTNDKAVSIHSARRGNPFVNFTDGTDLISLNEANGGQPKNLASADFDSDGIADLVTADAGGMLKFYRGNDLKKGDKEAFELTDKSFSLNISPDFLFAGDFNADGKPDVLAATKGANFLTLLSGDGRGNFSQPNAVAIDGNITALTTGETGRKDGQMDVAVAVTNKNGAFLLVFEHPESAFKHKPEAFKLSAPATEIAIGNLDEDFYADIAVASGNVLTIIHGRGQAYPWDLIPTSGIKRPNAVVATRQLPFAISALTVGKFGSKRGQTLAILATDGNIYRLEPNRQEKPSNNKLPEQVKVQAVKNLFVPTDAEFRNFATISVPQMSREEAEKNGVSFVDTAEIAGGKYAEYLQKKQEEAAEKYKNTDKKELEKMVVEGMPKTAEQREKAKQGFLRSISGSPSTLAKWSIETLATGSQFANVSASNSSNKMMRVNVSSGNLDDILLVDTIGNRVQLVQSYGFSRETASEARRLSTAEAVTLNVEGNPLAVLPMRLNTDAVHDLVVLRSGATVPSIVMTAPANTFTVTSTDDTGDCQSGNPCSLRSAILLANAAIGVDEINFSVATITPTSELPVITEGVNIFGSVNGSGQPSVEITGVNVPAPADGLKIRTIDTFVFGIAVNSFKSIPNGNGSLIGGNGITIESTIASPGNGNNVILTTFLGTDTTGTVDKGNEATGLNIFDTDNNEIIQNVISGNDGAGISVVDGNSNVFLSNIIGLNAPGTAKLGNGYGLFFTGSDNVFGGNNPGDGNTVSGNGTPYPNDPGNRCGGVGMLIPVLVNEDFELLTFNNLIQGNRFGTNPAGTLGLGNCSQAIQTVPLTGTVIGSITEDGRNVISDNGLGGVYCGFPFTGVADETEFGFCAIAGNNIGTDITGTLAIPNDLRNILSGAQPSSGAVLIINNQSLSIVGAPGGTTPGGNCTGFCNLISGNYNPDANNVDGAILAGGVGIIGIFNNYVGTNKSGNQALPNNLGVALYSTISANFAPTFFLGDYGLQNGEPVSLGNLISGNRNGITLGVGPQNRGDYFVLGNRIGTDATGTFAVPNLGGYGGALNLLTGFGNNVQIGSTNPLGRNIISGNGGDGIGILSGVNVNIVNNLIGLNSSLNFLGNGRNGIVTTGYYTKIGGSAQEANQIYANGTSGANFAGVLVANGAYGTTISENSISNNSGLGIDLSPNGLFIVGDGVTPNDCNQDADFGANDFQNFPELLLPVQNGDGTLTVEGVLRSIPRESFTIDFYSNAQADTSGYGEGATYLGTVIAVTDGNGFSQFTFTSATPVSTTLAITATATDGFGNTSEFSAAAGTTPFTTLEELGSVVCPAAIVVNITGDQADANINDGFCDVDTSNSGEQCSLRAAIEEANHRPGFNLVDFNIPGGGIQTITPTAELPDITQPVSINATTQPGYTDVNKLIAINGTNVGTGKTGLTVRGGNSRIIGLIIYGFAQGGGVALRTGNGNSVSSCNFGTLGGTIFDPIGAVMAGGILVSNSHNNKIGGTSFPTRNVILRTFFGIDVQDSNSNSIQYNVLFNNYVGVNLEDAKENNVGTYGSNDFFQNVLAGIHISDISPPEPTPLQLKEFLKRNSGKSEAEIDAEIERLRPQLEYFKNFSRLTKSLPETTSSVTPQIAITKLNYIIGNRIGTNPNNATHLGNTRGVMIGVSESNYVGKNVISANTEDGILLSPFAEKNIIDANIIGLTEAGNAPLGNKIGITISGNRNRIRNNFISGNRENGVSIFPGDDAPLPVENDLENNRIGTNVAGDTAIPNLFTGVVVKGTRNKIGTSAKGNLISGNGLNGISILGGATENTVRRNVIGTKINGEEPLPNEQYGVFVEGSDNIIGGDFAEARNKISGNQIGIAIGRITSTSPDDVKNNKVQGNYIGTNLTGTNPIPNTFDGIVLYNGANNNTIGGATANAGNIISGNGRYGISVAPQVVGGGETPFANKIQGNRIGTDITGTVEIKNTHSGIFVSNAIQTLIGGFGAEIPLARNIISGNGTNGVVIQDNATQTRVSGNYIGTQSDGTTGLGNTSCGVRIASGAFDNIIGGMETNAGNVIAFNGRAGICLLGDAGTGNLIDPNSIFGNDLQGIDFNDDGQIQPNDPDDADTGPNNLQNSPEIVSKQIVNDELIITFRIDSVPQNSNYGTNGLYVEFFKSDLSGEGERFLGFAYYTETDYNNGNLAGTKTVNLGNIATLGINANDPITATTTDSDGNTSEFAQAFAPLAANVSISGKVTRANGTGIGKATVSLINQNGETRIVKTSPFGFYRFEEIPAGESYVLSVGHKSYQFANPTRILFVTEALEDVDFIASP